MPVLKTRLYKPVLRAQYVYRERIFEYLDLHSDNSLILFVAPAGYGKSVTTSQWIDRRESKFGWISIDSDCNDLCVFLNYLVSSIQLSYPSLLTNIEELCKQMDLPSVPVISSLFINEISKLEEDFILVLDDYHLINSLPVHELLNEILKYLPEKLKLVLLMRRDPPLILSSMKAYDRVTEIRMTELRFDVNEVVELSQKTMPGSINLEKASELVALTEGWIIGLKMALYSMNHGSDIEHRLSGLGREMHLVSQFLTDEIVQLFSPEVRECLYKASILSRFCLDILLDICLTQDQKKKHSSETEYVNFNEVTKRTLFIIPLDSDQKWFRFHHLFGEILHKQLVRKYTTEQISDLHKKASRWFKRNGYYNEALSHAITSNDLDFANQILESQVDELFKNEKLSDINRWLKMFPAEATNKYVSLNLIQALLCDFNQDLTGLEKALNASYKILITLPESDINNIRWGYYYALLTLLLYKTGRIQESLVSSGKALDLLFSQNSLLRDNALLYHAFALVAIGKSSEADKKVMEFKGLIPANDHLGLARNSLVVAFISFFSGNLPRIYTSLYPDTIYYKSKLHNITGSMNYYYLGFVNYQWNHLDEVGQLFDEIWEHRFAGGPRWILQSIYIQILTCHAKGNKAEVNNLFEKARQYVNELELPVFDQLLASMEIEIALKDKAFSRVEKYRYTANFDQYIPYCFYFVPQLTRVKLKLAEGGDGYIPAAQKDLSEIIEYLQNTHNITLLIQAMILQVTILKLQGKETEALNYLSEIIAMARPSGFIRVFVDGGKEIRDLLIHLKNETKEDIYLSKILEAFPPVIDSDYKKGVPKFFTIAKGEDLTDQEIEILKLLGKGLQNKQIAEKLFLSPNSIKKYVYDIFKKLEVNKRSNAVEKAKQMELI